MASNMSTAKHAEARRRRAATARIRAQSAVRVLARYDNADPLLDFGTHVAGRSAAFASDCAPTRRPPGFLAWPGYTPTVGNLLRWLCSQQ
jgi:uncharacterized membrane protein